MTSTDFPWLTLIGIVPLLGTGAVLFAPRSSARLIGLGTSLVVLVMTIAMCLSFEPNGERFQFDQSYVWIKQFGVHYAVGADGIALVLIAMTAILVPVVLLGSWHEADLERVRRFVALLLVLETMMIGVFAATDVFLFYVFFEAMLIPVYFLIGGFGGPQRSYAAVKFLLYSLLGGLLMLAAVIGLYVVAAQQGRATFLYSGLQGLHITHGVQTALFLGFFIAFAIKAPLWPFHTWLPDAAAEAPIGVAVLLVGVLDKVGTFGMIRYCLPLFPDASKTWGPWILALCVIGIVYGALVAVGQRDLRRLVAYTSVSHFGFIALGIFAFTSQGQAGSTLYMVNHGFSTGALFLVVGFMMARRRSAMIDAYGGVYQVTPWLAGMVLIAGLSSLALPGLNSFVSEFLVLVGTFTRYPAYGVIATVGIILAAIYVLVMFQRTMTGPVTDQVKHFKDLDTREAFVIAPLVAIIIALGFYPRPALDVITPAVDKTLVVVGTTDPRPDHPVTVSAPRR